MDDILVTKSQFSRDINTTPSYVSNAIAQGWLEGAISVDARGKERIWRQRAAMLILRNSPQAGAKNPDMYAALRKLAGQEVLDLDGESYDEARRRKMVSEANIRELKENELRESLVSREKVESQLFEAGKRIREAILQVPDAIVDDVLASVTRDEAHNLIYETLEKVLLDIVEAETNWSKDDER